MFGFRGWVLFSSPRGLDWLCYRAEGICVAHPLPEVLHLRLLEPRRLTYATGANAPAREARRGGRRRPWGSSTLLSVLGRVLATLVSWALDGGKVSMLSCSRGQQRAWTCQSRTVGCWRGTNKGGDVRWRARTGHLRLSLQIDSEPSHVSIAKAAAVWFLQLKHPSSRRPVESP